MNEWTVATFSLWKSKSDAGVSACCSGDIVLQLVTLEEQQMLKPDQ